MAARTIINARRAGDERCYSIVVPRTYAELEQKLRRQFGVDALASDVLRLTRTDEHRTIVRPFEPLTFHQKEVVDVDFISAAAALDDETDEMRAAASRARATAAVAAATASARSVISSSSSLRASDVLGAFARVVAVNVPAAAASPTFTSILRLAPMATLAPGAAATDADDDAAAADDVCDRDDDDEIDDEDAEALLSAFEQSLSEDTLSTVASAAPSSSALPFHTASIHFLALQPWLRQARSSRLALEQLAAELRIAFEGPFDVLATAAPSASHQSHLVALRNHVGYTLRVHRLLLPTALPPRIHSLDAAQNALVVILLCVGGFFAGAVCHAGRTLAHKTFHRYVVRAKQGGRQVAKDTAVARNIRSVGASMRRHHEQRLCEEIRELIGAWQAPLRDAQLVIVHAPGAVNRNILFGGSAAAAAALPSAPAPGSGGAGAHLDLTRTYVVRKLPVDGDASSTPSSSAAAAACAPGGDAADSMQRSITAAAAIGVQCVLDASDARISSCPFAVGRATLQQALSVYRSLTTVEWSDGA